MGFYINDQLPSQTIKPEIPSEIDILTIQITQSCDQILVKVILLFVLKLLYVSYQISMKK